MVGTRRTNAVARSESSNNQQPDGNVIINDPLNLWPDIEGSMSILGQELIDALTRAARYGQEDDIQDGEAEVQGRETTRHAEAGQEEPGSDDVIPQSEIYGPVSRREVERGIWPGKSLQCAKAGCRRTGKFKLGCSQTKNGASDGELCTNWVHREIGCAGVSGRDYRENVSLKWSCEMGEYEHDFPKTDRENEEDEERRGKGSGARSRRDRGEDRSENEHDDEAQEGNQEDEDDEDDEDDGGETGEPTSKPVDKGKEKAKAVSAHHTRQRAPPPRLNSRSPRPSGPADLFNPETDCRIVDCKHPNEPLAHPADASRAELQEIQCRVVENGSRCVNRAHRDCAWTFGSKKQATAETWQCDRQQLLHDFGTMLKADKAARRTMKRRREGKNSEAASTQDGNPDEDEEVEATPAKKPRKK